MKKSCMKRINSLNIPRGGRNWRKGSGLSKQSLQSYSASEEASVTKSSSLRMLQVQEEAGVDKVQQSVKKERVIQLLNSTTPQQRRSSEPMQSSSACSRQYLGNLAASKSCDHCIKAEVELKGHKSCQASVEPM